MQKRVRYTKRMLVLLGITAIILLSSLSIRHPQVSSKSNLPERVKVYSESFIPHAPISITNDGDFEKLGFEGNGTEISPYLIQDLSIDGDNAICISIVSTSVHFVIQNCELFSGDDKSGTGVYFEKVANGAVKDCNIHTLYFGIYILKSDTCAFRSNLILTFKTGIYLDQSAWLSIEGNEISKSEYGMHLSKMDDSDLWENNIIDCDYGVLIGNSVAIHTWSNLITDSFFGLYFHNSQRCESFSNMVSTSRFGVYFAYSQDCNITSSEITRNRYGISLLEVVGGVISSNLAKLNSEHGIHVKDSRDIEITSNTVFENSGVGIYLLGVSGTSISKNEVGYNKGANAADFIGSSIKGLVNNWDTNAWSDYLGTMTYRISGDRGSLDNDPHYIIYVDSPSDVTLEAPATGAINWSAAALRPNLYSVSIDLVIVDEGIWDGANVTTAFTGLNPGMYSFALSLSTQSGITASDTVTVNVIDSTNPEWLQIPEDQVIECGSMLAYQLDASDHYGIAQWWVNNSEFSIDNGLLQNINSLDFGVYYLEVRAYDPYDNYVSHTLSITVTDTIPPSVDSPPDIMFVEGETGQSIIWHVYDYNPSIYEIYRDGVLVETGEWIPDMTTIEVSLEGLESGTYAYTINLIDIAGNNVTDSVDVTVEESVITEIPTTPTSPTETETTSTPTTTSGTEPTGDNGMGGMNTLVLGIIGIGGVMFVLVVVVLKKR